MNWTRRKSSPTCDVGVEPPAETCVELLRPIDIGDWHDHDLEPHLPGVHRGGARRAFAARVDAAHLGLHRLVTHRRGRAGPRRAGNNDGSADTAEPPLLGAGTSLPSGRASAGRRRKMLRQSGSTYLSVEPKSRVAATSREIRAANCDRRNTRPPGPCQRGPILRPQNDALPGARGSAAPRPPLVAGAAITAGAVSSSRASGSSPRDLSAEVLLAAPFAEQDVEDGDWRGDRAESLQTVDAVLPLSGNSSPGEATTGQGRELLIQRVRDQPDN